MTIAISCKKPDTYLPEYGRVWMGRTHSPPLVLCGEKIEKGARQFQTMGKEWAGDLFMK